MFVLLLSILLLNGALGQRRPSYQQDQRQEPREPEYPRYPAISYCEEEYGLQYYPHPDYCDQYYSCENGTLTEGVCENGLLFDGSKGIEPRGVHDGCDYNWAVNCEGRTHEQVAQGRGVCEYSFGIFSAGPCQTFYHKCVFGDSTDTPCIEGLAYDERIHTCNWPDLLIEDYNCDPSAIVGFNCPEYLDPKDPAYKFLPFPRFPAKDRAKYITCVDGHPRLISCGYGSSFNPDILACESDEYYE